MAHEPSIGVVSETVDPAISIATPFADLHGRYFGTILVDPPYQFINKTGKVAPEHRRLRRYATMTLAEIMALPVAQLAAPTAHLYLWCPNALLPDGLAVMKAWGFSYKTNLIWFKVRADGGPDGRGVGFYFRNVTELALFGVRGKNARTLAPARRQVNLLATRKREHSRKPDEIYSVVEACSPGPFLELFARNKREGWTSWGDEAEMPRPRCDEAIHDGDSSWAD
jgi:N6-adenosine-specific RNA methylase IME4